MNQSMNLANFTFQEPNSVLLDDSQIINPEKQGPQQDFQLRTSSGRIPKEHELKTSEEIELERLDEMKKRRQKLVNKRQKYYLKKIASQGQVSSQVNSSAVLNSSMQSNGSQKRQEDSYIKHILLKGKGNIIKKNLDKIVKNSRKKKMEGKSGGVKRKTLTVAKPFMLKTGKRPRIETEKLLREIEQEEKGTKSEIYVPLCKQIQQNFKLRESIQVNNDKLQQSNRKLTIPQSFMLSTEQRSKLKDFNADIISQDMNNDMVQPFKPLPFNKKLFTSQPNLPQVEKKQSTAFKDFKLSQTNKVEPNTARASLLKQGSPKSAFKARPLDKQILAEPDFVPVLASAQKTKANRIHMSPFQLNTEDRMRSRSRVHAIDSSDTKKSLQNSEQKKLFKAKEMPNYKFFEPKIANKETKKQVEFQEFKLSYKDRSASKMSHNGSEQKDANHRSPFRAKPVPDFNKLHTMGHNTPQKSQTTQMQPFNLTTLNRGTEKKVAFDLKTQQELQSSKENFVFKAREVNLDLVFNAPPKVSMTEKVAKKTVTKTMQVTFASDLRQQKRQEFDQKIKQKEMLKQEEIRRQQEIEQEREQAEIEALRSQMVFKASGIRKFKPIEANVESKKLTVPVEPKFKTSERAHLKDTLNQMMYQE